MSQRVLSLSCSGLFDIFRLLPSNGTGFPPHPSLRFNCHAAMPRQGCGESCCSDFAEARIGQNLATNRQFQAVSRLWMPQFHLHRHWNACGSARCVTMDSSCWHLWASSQVFRTHWPFWMILWFLWFSLTQLEETFSSNKWFCSSSASWGLFLFCAVWVSINQGCIDLEATLGYKTHVAATALHLECGASLCSCHCEFWLECCCIAPFCECYVRWSCWYLLLSLAWASLACASLRSAEDRHECFKIPGLCLAPWPKALRAAVSRQLRMSWQAHMYPFLCPGTCWQVRSCSCVAREGAKMRHVTFFIFFYIININ